MTLIHPYVGIKVLTVRRYYELKKLSPKVRVRVSAEEIRISVIFLLHVFVLVSFPFYLQLSYSADPKIPEKI